MKIVHLAPNAPYNEGWSYQENILPKYQMKLGHEVVLVVSNLEHHDGSMRCVPCSDFVTVDGFRVVRKKVRLCRFPVLGRLLSGFEIYEFLQNEKPDFIFHHGLCSWTIFEACRYKRKVNPDCVIVQDNHLDFNIGRIPKTLKGYVHRVVLASVFLLTKRYISKVYGVTPWRAQYAKRIYGVPQRMLDVLIMGADDEKIDFAEKEVLREQIRQKYSVGEDFLIITGGKIDRNKKIHLLMEAVNRMDGVRLIVFGNVLDDIKDEFMAQMSDKVSWTGFIPADDAYNYFLAADLVVFPGQHSVLWEQACACKVPCVFGKWDKMDHVDAGGNALFVDDVSADSLKETVESLVWTEKYEEMKRAAESEKTDVFLYSRIAEKSLEMSCKK